MIRGGVFRVLVWALVCIALASPLMNVAHGSATSIANTNSVYSLQFTHQVLVRLPNGTLVATFSSNLYGTINPYAVYVVSSNDNGSTWGTPTKISGMTSGNLVQSGIYGCVVAADSNNNVYVAWTGVTDGSTYFQVWCARYDGSGWSAPVQVSQGSGLGVQAFYTSIAVDGNDNVHLVWQSFIDGYSRERIFYSKYDGTWSSPIAISTQPNNAAYYQMYPCIAVDSSNNLHVVWSGWTGYTNGENQIWYAKYDGVWQVPVDISARPDLHSGNNPGPCIAVDSNDNLHVVWNGICASIPTDQIWYTNYTTSWSTPLKINNGTGMSSSSQMHPSIAVDSNNNIHVAWMNTTDYTTGVNLFYTSCTTSWSTPVEIEGYNSECPHFRWSFYPSSNSVTSELDYVFLRGPWLTFNSMLPSMPPPSSFSVVVSPLSASISIGQSLTFTSLVTGGTSPYSYQWYLNGTPVSGATSASWAFEPPTSGTYYVYLKVTDSTSNTAQSETAKITVSSAGPPTQQVGGEWSPIDKFQSLAPWLCLAFTTAIAACFAGIRRFKKKQS